MFGGCHRSGADDESTVRLPIGQVRDQALNGPIKVVATVGMVGDLVREIGGSRVAVRTLMGSGVDPHLYKATRNDVLALLQAEIVFQNGLLLEGKMVHVLSRTAHSRPVVPIGAEILSEIDERLHDGDHLDPHIWMDVSLWARGARRVGQRLAEYDPAGAEYYLARAEQLARQLDELHAYGRQVLATIPETSRVLVTSHDAFGWFGQAYGIEVFGVQGLSTESEAGLRHVNLLVDILCERHVSAVFLESSVPARGIAALVDGARARGWAVRIAGPLYSDALGPAGTYEGTYIGMLDHNITLVARELGGTAPPGGWQGRLSGAREQASAPKFH